MNEVGKAIYWLMEKGQFFLVCQYVKSELNISDKFTRESPGLGTSITDEAFRTIWDYFGPFQWDLMATYANVNKNLNGELMFSNKICIYAKRCFAFLHYQ